MSNNILSGLIFCGLCGGNMFITYSGKNKNKYKYFLCTNRNNSLGCNQEYIKANLLEKLIIKKLQHISKNHALINKFIKTHNQKILKKKKEFENKLSSIKKEIAEIDTQINKILDLLMKLNPNTYTIKEAERRLKEITEKREELHKEQIRVENKINEIQTKDIEAEAIAEYIKEFSDKFFLQERNIQRLWVQAILEKVVVYNSDKIEISYTIPLEQVPKNKKDQNTIGSHFGVTLRPRNDKNNNNFFRIKITSTLQEAM